MVTLCHYLALYKSCFISIRFQHKVCANWSCSSWDMIHKNVYSHVLQLLGVEHALGKG